MEKYEITDTSDGVSDIILRSSIMNFPALYFLLGSHLRGMFSYHTAVLQTGRTYGPICIIVKFNE